MSLGTCCRIAALGLALLPLVSIPSALAAANTVPPTKIANASFAIGANGLKPAICAGLNLTSIKAGSGIFAGNTGSTLILGSSGIDTITGQAGDDCILGGGADVLVGGPGIDTCAGGLGSDTCDSSCEVQVP